MKVHQIKKSLNELKEEDQIKLKESINRIKELEDVIRIKDRDVTELEQKNKKYQILDNIKSNIYLNIYLVISTLELPISVILVILAIICPLSIQSCIILLVITSLVGMDGIRNYIEVYNKVSYNEEGTISKILATLKELIKNREIVKSELFKTHQEYEDNLDKLEGLKRELNLEMNQVAEIRDELSYLEGCLIGINKVIEKNIIEEFPDQNLVVDFVTRKQELKRKV